MPKTARVSMLGEDELFLKGTEWADQTTSPTGADAPSTQFATAYIEINQKKFEQNVALSDEEIEFAVVSGADLDSQIQQKVARGAGRTIDAVILNGDTTATATGNVNLDDSTPSATSYYLNIDNGIRKLALANNDTSVGAMTFADFITVKSSLRHYSAVPADCLWLFEVETFNKAMGIDEFTQQYINGQSSTVVKGTLSNILGSDLIVHRDFPKTEADGKVSNTAGNNTFGGFAYIYKPAIQYGFGRDLKIETVRVAGKGYQFVATLYFGFVIAYPSVAGGTTITDPTVAIGYNVTL
jgi:HK97 family phage major capsid protein